MCGIIGFADPKNPVNELVANQYEDQHSRGDKGFGIINIEDDGSYVVNRATEGAKFMYDLYKKESKCMIVHHRWPTSSPNYLSQTHPIVVDNKSLKHKYLVIHNGCVSNTYELKKEHEKLGFTYTTAETFITKSSWEQEKFNDSESLAIEVARFIEKQTDKIDILGSAAFIAVQIDKKKDKVINLFWGRNAGNPLNMSFSNGKLRLSSEGEGENIKEFMLYSWDLKGKIQKRKMPFKAQPTYQPISTVGFQDRIHCSTHAKANDDYTYPYKDPYDYRDAMDDDSLASITEFRTEEISKEVEEFFDILTDDLTMADADIEETLKNIKNVLQTAKKEVEEYYADRYASTAEKDNLSMAL